VVWVDVEVMESHEFQLRGIGASIEGNFSLDLCRWIPQGLFLVFLEAGNGMKGDSSNFFH